METGRGVLLVGFFGLLLVFDCHADETNPNLREGHANTEEKLIHDLFKRSTFLSRPVTNTSQTVRLGYGMALMAIENMDEVNQILETNVWIRQTWQDSFLTWDPAEYDGIDHVRFPSKKIWSPDMVVYNSRGETFYQDALAVVTSDGTVLHIPMARLKTHCSMDLTYFPMDTQTCSIKVGSWTYDGYKLDPEFYDGLAQMDTSDFMIHNEWNLITTSAVKNVKRYPCCVEPYNDLTFSLTVRRYNSYYKCVFIGPAVLLAMLAPFIFLLPPADSQKMTLGAGLLIAYALFFNTVGDAPMTHYSTPLIDKYYMTQYVLIVVSIMLSTLVANIARRSIRMRSPPSILNKVIIGGIGRCLCVSHDMYTDLPSSEEGKTELMESGGHGGNYPVQIREWLLIATVVDRLFFYLSFIITILFTVIILCSFP